MGARRSAPAAVRGHGIRSEAAKRAPVRGERGAQCNGIQRGQRHCSLSRGIARASDPGRRAVTPFCKHQPVGETKLFDLRVSVERIEGRSVCGLQVGDYFELTESSRVRIPEGHHFCLYAMSAVLPLLPAKQRRLPDEDWLEQDSLVTCPDPDERVIMRIERIAERTMLTEELT